MKIPLHIEQRIFEIVHECVKKASAHFNKGYVVPEIRFDVRGRRGGYAQRDRLINFNPILLMENQEEYFNQVVPHEVAHCIDYANGRGRSIHGPSWKAIMRLFGCEPDRCHNMDTSNAAIYTRAKFEYKCTGCDRLYLVSSVRHGRQQQYNITNPGVSFYHCMTCGRDKGGLVFITNHGQANTKEVPVQQLLPKPEFMGSNVELARRIFYYGNITNRQSFITKAVAEGMKASTASTYYAQLKRT